MPSNSSKPTADDAPFDLPRFLEKLGDDVTREIVLVGGQAVSFWAFRYQDRLAGLIDDKDLPTKDIDFCGRRELVALCATRLGGRAIFPDADNVVTPNTGKVLFVDDRGTQQHIDFLAAPFGLDEAEVRRLAVPFEVERPEGPLRFYVMHPVLSLESRVANTVSLPGYADWREHASVRVQSAASLSAIARSGPAQPAAYALRDDDVIQNLVTGRDEYIVVTPGVARYPPPLREAVERYFATNPHFSAEPPPGRDPDMDGP